MGSKVGIVLTLALTLVQTPALALVITLVQGWAECYPGILYTPGLFKVTRSSF